MSREIRFRAWIPMTEQMIGVDVLAISPVGWSSDGTGVSLAYQPHIKVMQFTGLRDRNGVEIYEGDILQGGHYPIRGEDGYVLVIEYDHDRFWGVRTLKSGSTARGISHGIADGLYEFVDGGIEVIGNIYENPELLEVAE
ncbi:YopX family protein [Sporosarcina sp. FSL W7-1349]|uniref:YopX family protein n=1 Tax=Sporosarcina sp. FSL W7-1349 TaxID=2921561 RepID=UPI0030F6592A